jgi:hypothetical protein
VVPDQLAEYRLCLRDLGDTALLGVPHVGLDDDERAADVKRLRHPLDVTLPDRAEEVRLRLDGRSRRPAVREVEEGTDAAQRVSERHQRAAVQHSGGRAALRRPVHPPHHFVGLGLRDLDAEGARQRDDVREVLHARGGYAAAVTGSAAASPRKTTSSALPSKSRTRAE